MLVLSFQHVSSSCLGFLVVSPCLGEPAKPIVFESFQTGTNVVFRGVALRDISRV